MGNAKLIRAFTVERDFMISEKGLSLPNPRWTMEIYESPNRSIDSRSFFVEKGGRTLKYAEVEAQTIAGSIETRPFVAVLTVSNKSFPSIKDGLRGVDARKGYHHAKFHEIHSIGAIKRYDEVVLDTLYLTPDWLRQLDARIGVGQLDNYNRPFYYVKFDQLVQYLDEGDRMRRK